MNKKDKQTSRNSLFSRKGSSLTTSSQATYVHPRAFWKRKSPADLLSVTSIRAVLPEPEAPRPGKKVVDLIAEQRLRPLLRQRSGKWFSRPPTPMGLFGELPEHLRQRIWTRAVTYDGTFILHSFRGDGKLNYYRTFLTKAGKKGGRVRTATDVRGLQFVSRGIKEETDLLFYQNNTFRIVYDDNAVTLLEQFRIQIGETNFEAIKNMRLEYCMTYEVVHWNPSKQDRMIDNLSENIKKMYEITRQHPKLKGFVLTLILEFGGSLFYGPARNGTLWSQVKRIEAFDEKGNLLPGPFDMPHSMLNAGGQRDGRQRRNMKINVGFDKWQEDWDGDIKNWEDHMEKFDWENSTDTDWAFRPVIVEGLRCLKMVRGKLIGVLPVKGS